MFKYICICINVHLPESRDPPTIVELAGLTLPSTESFDGVSLVPLLKNGNGTSRPAFSQYPHRVTEPNRQWDNNGVLHHQRSSFTHMGLGIRTEDWRFNIWYHYNGTSLRPLWNKIEATELYDHRNDTLWPISFNTETENVANYPEYTEIVKELKDMLQEHFMNDFTITI